MRFLSSIEFKVGIKSDDEKMYAGERNIPNEHELIIWRGKNLQRKEPRYY